jgi:hypothetical protein
MDFKVSRKETRLFPNGPAQVLVSNVFDIYPVFGNDKRYQGGSDLAEYLETLQSEERENLIVDVEILDDPREELLDRALFALVKQRGQNPVDPQDGVQWAEAVIGEVIAPVIIRQVHTSVSEEGPGVRAVPGTVVNRGKENLIFKIELTNAT